MLSATMDRVGDLAPDRASERIRRRTEDSVARCAQEYAASGGRSDVIERRLRRLDREWDVDRAFAADAAALSLLGLALGATVGRRWRYLAAGAGAMLLLHMLRGWCPPASLIHACGIRTTAEIARERYALKALRGDFAGVAVSSANAEVRSQQALRAARASA